MVKNSFVILLSILCLVTGTAAYAYVANSTNFSIENDVVSFGGGLSTSTSFSMEDSISDRQLGISTGVGYTINAGPLPMAESMISVSDPGILHLIGEITASIGGVADGSVAVTVVTNNPGGYQLRLSGTPLSSSSDSFGSFNGPAEWAVPDGSSAFGFSTSTNNSWNSIGLAAKIVDVRNTNNQPLGTLTTINFRAESRNLSSPKTVGVYNSSITLTALPL